MIDILLSSADFGAAMLIRKSLIYNCIINACRHPDAQEIFDALRDAEKKISLATVYRNLNELVDENKIRRITVPNQPDRYDTIIEPHDHLICLECGSIIDIPVIRCDIRKDTDFVIDHCDVIAYGYCPECRNLPHLHNPESVSSAAK